MCYRSEGRVIFGILFHCLWFQDLQSFLVFSGTCNSVCEIVFDLLKPKYKRDSLLDFP